MTPNRFYRWLAGLMVALACLSSGPLLRAQNQGSTDAVLLTFTGKVEVKPRGAMDWEPGHTNQILKLGDRLRTRKNSRATLRLSNLSILRVDELTSMEIQPPDSPGHRPVLNLESGAAYFFNRDKPSETQFRTPSASGAIRGTEFNMKVATDGRMELALLDGQVDLTNNQGTLQVRSGQEAIAEPGQAPRKAPMIDAVNIIQWTLYYPAILDTDELELNREARDALGASLDSYRKGDLAAALEQFPDNLAAPTDSEKVYHAALLLSVGRVDDADKLLQNVQGSERAAALGGALQEMIAAIKGEPWVRSGRRALATEWLAGSYQAQARRNLPLALDMAKRAAAKSPGFGFAQERLAELDFSFGQTDDAIDALKKALALSPRNAQAIALKGFLFAAQNKMGQAGIYFDKAVQTDGALANAWLGRGLVRIHQGHVDAGRKDLETAAALEPNRAFLRSYLGKAWSADQPLMGYGWDVHLATNELRRSMELDPKDPTAWLYSALLNDQRNCINSAIRDLEHSEDLNNNRAVFRSKFLLEQDQAVRSANLALIYEDAGMSDVAVREATKALDYDYANYSAHLFLSETYDALQDPKKEDLRYQTPWEDELLIANLLAPIGAGVLSQNISQEEYSRMFESDRVGVISQTEYWSRGAWLENGSIFGTSGPMSFSLDSYYYTDPGWRPNNNLDNSDFSAKIKYQLTPKDTAFLEVERSELDAGDPFEHFYYKTAGPVLGDSALFYDPTLKEYEEQDPNILLGYHRDWGTGNHTLFLYRGMQDHFSSSDQQYQVPIVPLGAPPGFNAFSIADPASMTLQRTTELNSFELQQLYESEHQNIIVGGRYQNEAMENANKMSVASFPSAPPFPLFQPYLPAETTHFDRLSAYAYYEWKPFDKLELTGGLTYDWEHYPLNFESPPFQNVETDKGRLSPKFGLDWVLPEGTRLRAAYTHSMGGVINDSSTTIEPTEVGGFNQAYRSLIPQSAGFGTPPALVFNTYGVGVDHKFPTGTYVDAEAQMLTSQGNQLIGAYSEPNPSTLTLSDLSQEQYFNEKDAFASINQLICKEASIGARFSLTSVDLTANDFSPAAGVNYPQHENSTLDELSLYLNYYVPCGFFARVEGNWFAQHNANIYYNSAGAALAEPGANFWQCNIYGGYRFLKRHGEVMVGVMNVFNQDYNVDPVTYFLEQAHNREFVASLKFNF